MNHDNSYFKTRLEEESKLLTIELSSMGRKDPNISGNWEASIEEEASADADKNVAADRVEEFVQNNAVISELEVRLKNVNDSLDKIRLGTYGVCEFGGEAIEEDRLEANPSSRTCKKHINELFA